MAQDVSNLSDDDLRALVAQKRAGGSISAPAAKAPSADVSSLSDSELRSLVAQKRAKEGISSPLVTMTGPKQSLWQSVVDRFTGAPDSEAKAMFETFGYPGGLVRTGVKELAKRIATGGKEGSGDIAAALKGQAPSSSESLKQAGVPAGIATPVGFVADIVTDPLAGMLSMKGAAAPAAGAATAAASEAGPKIINPEFMAPNAAEIRAAVKDVAGLDKTPGYMVTSDRPTKVLADSMLKEPTIGGAILRKEIKPVFEGLENFGKEVIAKQSAILSKYEAGNAAKKGIAERFKQMIAPAEDVYNELEKTFAKTPIETVALKRGLSRLARESKTDFTGSSQALLKNLEATLLGTVDDSGKRIGGIKTVQELREFRTNLGKYLDGNVSQAQRNIVGEMYDITTRERNRSILRSSVTTGAKISRSAKANELLKALKQADRTYGDALTTTSEALGVKGTNKQSTRSAIQDYLGKDTAPEKIVSDLFDKGDLNQLLRIKAAFPEQFDTLARRVVREIVEKSSPNNKLDSIVLLRKLNEYPPEVRKVLLGEIESKHRNAMTVIGALPKDYNPSHTSSAEGWRSLFTPSGIMQNAASIPKLGLLRGGAPAIPSAIARKAGEAQRAVFPAMGTLNASVLANQESSSALQRRADELKRKK